jgi:tetratricopeptide (TPR) repeat protein
MIERWLQTFQRDPRHAVDVLMSGRAGVGSDLRLDVPELLHQLFPDNERMAPDRARLDEALFDWLSTMRNDYSRQVDRLGFAVYGKRLVDALVALQLLDLPVARDRIRADLDAWIRALAPLRLAPERDPGLECWRLLTYGQPDAALVSSWLRLATDPRPEYLDVALSGLERFPTGGEASINQTLMLRALLQHAVRSATNEHAAKDFFDRRFSALRGLRAAFPRGPQYWRDVLADALDSFETRDTSRRHHDFVALLKGEQQKVQHGAPRKRTQTSQHVSLEQVNALFDAIDRSTAAPDELARRLFDVLERNYRYAEETGDSYYFTRTLCRLGSRLLKRGGLGKSSVARFGSIIERALAWAPMDAHCWMLWSDWFARQGHEDAHEWTLREMARLFPENEPARVELARLLIGQGEEHWNEAETWLREAAERNPDHPHSRVELARLLIRRGEDHWDEAERWLREAAERNSNNAPSRVELARLLIRRGEGHWDEAERWLREAAERNPDHEHSRVELARLLICRGEAHWNEAETWLREAAERNPNSEPSRVELARLLIRRGEDHWDEAEDWLRKVLADNRDSGSANVVLGALLIRRERREEAEHLLGTFSSRHPEDQIARDLMDHLTQGREFDFSALDDQLHADGSGLEASESAPPREPLEPPEAERPQNQPQTSHLAAPPSTAAIEAPVERLDSQTPSTPEQAPASRVVEATPAVAREIQDRAEPRTPAKEIERRGRLSAAFRRAQMAIARGETPEAEVIERQAARGDTLAGFYLQWLEPKEAPEPPPHAWAWNACRCWQNQAPAAEWGRLEQKFFELASETAFLHMLARPTDDLAENEIPRWFARFADEETSSWPPRTELMRTQTERLDKADERQRDDIALSVLASAALAAPEFSAYTSPIKNLGTLDA